MRFAEGFYRGGYEAALLASFARRPTPLTAWMLNRLLNGAGTPAQGEHYIRALEGAEADPRTDAATRSDVRAFLDRTG